MAVEIPNAATAIMETVPRSVLGLVLGLFLGRRFGAQLRGTLAVPAVDLRVRLGGEGFLGQVWRERLAVVGVLEIPVADGVLHEGDVLLGREQDLDRLPPYEPLGGQGGNVGLGVVIVARLDGVLTACHLPYVRDGLVRHFVEKGIVVAADGLIEGGELVGRQVFLVLVADFVNLVRARLLDGERRGGVLARTTHDILGDSSEESFEHWRRPLILVISLNQVPVV